MRGDTENINLLKSILDSMMKNIAVIKGITPLYILEYPCHSIDKKRWFLLYATPLYLEDSKIINGAVISHVNITDYKLIEEKFKEIYIDKNK